MGDFFANGEVWSLFFTVVSVLVAIVGVVIAYRQLRAGRAAARPKERPTAQASDGGIAVGGSVSNSTLSASSAGQENTK
ncbi:MAG: hypothetical protein AAF371_14350 [Pseudomonadota bacterium]